MERLVFLAIHAYCFAFFLRALFLGASEVYFTPMMRMVRDVTDPVLLAPKNSKLLKNPLNPWVPIFGLLLLKTLFIQSLRSNAGVLIFRDLFLFSLQGFIEFLFAFYLIGTFIAWSVSRQNMWGQIFNTLVSIIDRTLAFLPLKRPLHVRDNPGKSMGALFGVFFIIFVLTGLHLGLQNAVILAIEPASRQFNRPSLGGILVTFIGWFDMFILVRIVLSFFDLNVNTALQVLIALTDPVLRPFRRLGLVVGMFDFSPILALIAIAFCHEITYRLLLTLGQIIRSI